MDEKLERKKWTNPKVISLGKLTEIEMNDQISDEMKQQLITLRQSLKNNIDKEYLQKR